jgi:hypothetical protein
VLSIRWRSGYHAAWIRQILLFTIPMYSHKHVQDLPACLSRYLGMSVSINYRLSWGITKGTLVYISRRRALPHLGSLEIVLRHLIHLQGWR